MVIESAWGLPAASAIRAKTARSSAMASSAAAAAALVLLRAEPLLGNALRDERGPLVDARPDPRDGRVDGRI